MSSHRLTRIDELHLQEYRYLEGDDECYYLGEYTPHQDFNFSPTNDLVLNIKKPPKYRRTPAWRYKKRDIRKCARYFLDGLSKDWLRSVTLVPIPPSKARHHPEYDDRILRILKAICELGGEDYDVRELIAQGGSHKPSHECESRPRPDELFERYHLAQDLLDPAPEHLALVDDVITTGAHYRAAKLVFRETWPGIPIVGLFVARVVRLEEKGDAFDFPF